MSRAASDAKPVTVPAPTGGVNTVAALGAFPEGDCAYAYNVIAAEMGLRARLGYQEWCTNVLDASGASGLVRSVIQFTGTHKNGSTDKLFACTTKGIYDVTASSTSPTLVVTFPIQSGEAGYGVSTVVSTPGGRFLVYCDEENGAYVYTESSTSWQRVGLYPTAPWVASTAVLVGNQLANGINTYVCTVAGTTAASGGPTGQGTNILDGTARWDFYQGPWTAATAYAINARVTNGSSPKRVYICSVAGTSAGAGGPTGTGSAIVDNTARWNYLEDYTTPIGPSLADQQLGYSAAPVNFAHCVVWKSRLWFVERDTTRAWYLGVNSVFGTAQSFDFGSRMRAGGPLVGLYNWSYDAGNGLDSLLVAISTSGDVIMYAGTDPTSAQTFGLKGTWSVGAVPYGRRIATDFGGDLLVMSATGVVPLSKLVLGQPVTGGDRSVYVTEKISNVFALAVSTNRLLPGWAIVIHPEENALMLLTPAGANQATTQLAYAFGSKGWFQYRYLPMYCAVPFGGKMYFGTADGRVCINTGYVDGVKLSDPSAYLPVLYSFLTGFSNLGTAKLKMVRLVRPSVLSQTPNPTVQATARYDFDTSEPPPPGKAQGSSGGPVWDTAVWDGAVWGGDFSPVGRVGGATGVGREVAIAVQGQATSRTIVVSCDVWLEEGGDL